MLKRFLAPAGAFLFVAVVLSSCSDSEDETAATSLSSNDQIVQQIGEMMISVDESSGNSSGTIVRGYNNVVHPSSILNSHTEATCSGVSFAACASDSRVKNFGGCTLAGGLLTVDGNVTLTFVGTGAASCTMPTIGDMVMRVPAYSASLPSGAGIFTVAALTASGQILTRTGASSYEFNNTGVRRTFTGNNGSVALDMTTQTTSDITLTGNSRLNRTITGGSLQLTNNLNSQVCTVSPNAVTWTSANCGCPTSGTWTGSCSTGENINVAFTSTCGSVGVSFGATSKTLTLDRCN